MFLYTVVISIFLLIVLPFLFLTVVLRKGGELAGWYIRRKTQARRELLLSRAAAEHKQYASEEKNSGNQEDEEWEKVESSAGKTVLEKSKRDGDWEGIIGFFHPFWYVTNLLSLNTLRDLSSIEPLLRNVSSFYTTLDSV